MARKLEKVEKELGYCDIKLEKERRLRKQIEFIDADSRNLGSLIAFLSVHETDLATTHDRDAPSRESFLSMALLELARDKRDLLTRELEDMKTKLRHFTGFDDKKRTLELEKRLVIRNMPPARVTRIRRLNEEFKRMERVWNELSEDLLNLDEGIFCIQRTADYLQSCRNFLTTAKSNYDVENTQRQGFLTDLFRHSTLGRALQMADGADRNLELAERELVCISGIRVSTEAFAPVHVRFVDALFEDLYTTGRLERTMQTIEAGIAATLKFLEQLRRRRENLSNKLEATEKNRDQLFSRMGKGRRREMSA
jgi:hypothetical protein